MAGENTIEPFGPRLPGAEGRRAATPGNHPAPEDGEAGDRLRAYWLILRCRRWTMLSAVLVALTLVTIYTAREKPLYRAGSLVEIERENPDLITVQQLFRLQGVSYDYLNTQYKILKSDGLARDVIRKLQLDGREEFNPAARRWPWRGNEAGGIGHGAAREQAILGAFQAHLGVAPVPQSRLVNVTFDSHDPRLAAGVVNALVADYIQQNLEARWKASQQASAWLSQQLDGLKIKLEKSEDNLQQYAQANGLLFLESSQGQNENIVDQRLRELQDELTRAQADLYQKASLYHLVEAGDYAALPGVFDNRMMQELTVKLAGLEQEKAELAANFNANYPKRKEVQSQIDGIRDFLRQQHEQAARNIEDSYLAARRRAELVGQAFAEQQKQANVVAEKSVEYNILQREVATNKRLYEGLLERLKEAGISAGLKASNIRVVDPAVAPAAPVEPRIPLNLAVGLVAGLVCGISIAFLRERLDDTLKTPDDVESFLGAPALALIPSGRAANGGKNALGHAGQRALTDFTCPLISESVNGPRKNGNGWPRVDAAPFLYSPLAEAFRGLRSSVLLSIGSRPPRSLLFVSAEPAEGKTTICSNLAISLAQLGKRVLIVDADLRRPMIHEVFHISASSGLAEYLAGEGDWGNLVQPTGRTGLECLACGPAPSNPSELIFSTRMRKLVGEAATRYDLVLIDAPPLLHVADGRILSTMVEGVVMVVKGGATRRQMARRAEIYVSDVGGRLIGVVLNNVDPRRDGYYHPRYGDCYPRGNGQENCGGTSPG